MYLDRIWDNSDREWVNGDKIWRMICKINNSLHLRTTNKTEISKKILNKATPTILI